MGYFSNGTEGDSYSAEYCERCIHGHENPFDCAVWAAHIDLNYEECNNEESILHRLIPIDGVFNGQCRMFVEVKHGD